MSRVLYGATAVVKINGKLYTSPKGFSFTDEPPPAPRPPKPPSRWWWGVIMLIAVWGALMFALSGCGSTAPRPCQDVAERIVWREQYHETGAAPAVGWVYGDQGSPHLTCAPDPQGRPRGFLVVDLGQTCVAGVFYQEGWFAWVAWPDDVPPRRFSQTAYSHELMHAHLQLLYGDGDTNHTREEWTTLLPQTTTILQDDGL